MVSLLTVLCVVCVLCVRAVCQGRRERSTRAFNRMYDDATR